MLMPAKIANAGYAAPLRRFAQEQLSLLDLIDWTGDPRCGTGFTFRAGDGREWTYCHLSYEDPTIGSGATISAGQPVGLVGHTGHATGPHLHLQLQPATSYPQSEAWFERFAGSAFTWQDAPTMDTAGPVFEIVGGNPAPPADDPVITFTHDPVIAFTLDRS